MKRGQLFFIVCSRKNEKGILPNVLEHIGNTPLVRINKINLSEGLECELCEYYYELIQNYYQYNSYGIYKLQLIFMQKKSEQNCSHLRFFRKNMVRRQIKLRLDITIQIYFLSNSLPFKFALLYCTAKRITMRISSYVITANTYIFKHS